MIETIAEAAHLLEHQGDRKEDGQEAITPTIRYDEFHRILGEVAKPVFDNGLKEPRIEVPLILIEQLRKAQTKQDKQRLGGVAFNQRHQTEHGWVRLYFTHGAPEVQEGDFLVGHTDLSSDRFYADPDDKTLHLWKASPHCIELDMDARSERDVDWNEFKDWCEFNGIEVKPSSSERWHRVTFPDDHTRFFFKMKWNWA
ncbi:hypothetical protein JNW90_13780 [Micromonospora sp. STR1s_5]|nr:hypothetical protein [Micromonospora sp. STR1s_5]